MPQMLKDRTFYQRFPITQVEDKDYQRSGEENIGKGTFSSIRKQEKL